MPRDSRSSLIISGLASIALAALLSIAAVALCGGAGLLGGSSRPTYSGVRNSRGSASFLVLSGGVLSGLAAIYLTGTGLWTLFLALKPPADDESENDS